MVAKKYENGRSLHSLLMSGMFFTKIISEIEALRIPIDQSLTLHNIYESSSLKNQAWVNKRIEENLKNLRANLTPQIKNINEHISLANKLIQGLDFKDNKIPSIKVNNILPIVRKRLRTKFEVDSAQKVSNESFFMQLNRITQPSVDAIFEFLKVIDNEEYSDELAKISDSYRYGIKQALHVCSIGYYSTSVFIAGRSTEDAVNDYFMWLFRTNKVKEFQLDKTPFENKINQLHSKKYVNDNLYHKLSTIRIDRNNFGHPSTKLLTKKQAHLRIRNIMECIPELHNKIKKLERQYKNSKHSLV